MPATEKSPGRLVLGRNHREGIALIDTVSGTVTTLRLSRRAHGMAVTVVAPQRITVLRLDPDLRVEMPDGGRCELSEMLAELIP
jgi:hypothetical protein